MAKELHILIIEDEELAAVKLMKLIQSMELEIETIHHCDSVERSIAYLGQNNPDLIFMDIRLGDGLSFEIFESVKVTSPIIFTTAYDEYALKAFTVNSVHYLLKPIQIDDLKIAIAKYLEVTTPQVSVDMKTLIKLLKQPEYKQRYFIKKGATTYLLSCSDIQYFYTDEGYTFAMAQDGKRHLIDATLDHVQNENDEKQFFRINRSMLIRNTSILKMEPYFNSRLILTLNPNHSEQVVVARERVKDLKEWLE